MYCADFVEIVCLPRRKTQSVSVSPWVIWLLNYWFLGSWINVGILDLCLSYSTLENNTTCIKMFIVLLWKTWAGAEWQNRFSQLCIWQPGFVDLETLWTLGSACRLHLLGSWRTQTNAVRCFSAMLWLGWFFCARYPVLHEKARSLSAASSPFTSASVFYFLSMSSSFCFLLSLQLFYQTQHDSTFL